MCKLHHLVFFVAIAASAAFAVRSADAAISDVSIAGSDAIFLAGRTDVLPIPPPLAPFVLARHNYITPENIAETLPPSVSVSGGDVVQFANAAGGVSYFNGFGAPLYGPSGNGVSGSNLTALGGISGYIGPQGPITGVFLDNNVPLAGAPPTLDFTPAGVGIDFLSLSPVLGQVFYVGDGLTSGNVTQQFIAPVGATRLFLGIADGFGFVGAPGAYEDNDGGYRIRVGVNENPAVPEPAALAVWSLLAVSIAAVTWTRKACRTV